MKPLLLLASSPTTFLSIDFIFNLYHKQPLARTPKAAAGISLCKDRAFEFWN